MAPPRDAGVDLLACHSEKFTFTQANGCQGDGSVEFCVAAADAALQARVLQIAPSVRCGPGGGRARCDTATELLCFYPTGDAECVILRGALRDAAWQTLCEIAGLDGVRSIVPTFFE